MLSITRFSPAVSRIPAQGHPFRALSDPYYSELALKANRGEITRDQLEMDKPRILATLGKSLGRDIDTSELFSTLQEICSGPVSFSRIHEIQDRLTPEAFEDLVLTCPDKPTF